MKGIILAAGRGSRMKDLTDERPKCLVEFDGKTLLSRQLGALRGAGVDEIAIVTGYRHELLDDLADRSFHNPEWQNTNMVASLRCAGQWLESEPCIVTYSDIFYGVEAVTSLMATDALLAITYDPNWRLLWEQRFGDPLLDAETFRRDERGLLVEIGGTPDTVAEVEGQYMGLLQFRPQGWAEIERIVSSLTAAQARAIDMTSLLQRVIDAGRIEISTVALDGPWGEIDSEQDLRLYDR